MKPLIQKDKKNRKLFSHVEKKRKVLKFIASNIRIPFLIRWKACVNLSFLPRASSLSRVRKRCVLTGRSRFILGKFNLSRLCLRKLVTHELIPGIKKSSW